MSSGKGTSRPVTIVGESICGGNGSSVLVSSSSSEVYLRGYNTISGYDPTEEALSVEGTGEIISAVNGIVEVTDRVVSVKGCVSRYLPEIGDIVVGRVTEVSGNKWLVDVNCSQLAIMLLSNVTEPGGMLRRRERGDELSMRQLFDQADLVVAEVQRISPEGVASLHTRAADKYGKLSTFGQLIRVSPSLIKRAKHQFVTLPEYQCSLIIGINGGIWVSTYTKEASPEDTKDTSLEDSASTSSDALHSVARVANCLKALNAAQVPIHPKTITAAMETSLSAGWSPYDVTSPANLDTLVARVLDVGGVKRPRS